MPTISVIIPTYNTSQYVVQAVQSVLVQTYQDIEIIVVDDGSTDDTHAMLTDFAGQIRYIYQNNQERSAARNTGIALAQGEYIAFLDADDYWHPTKLEKQIALLAQRPELGMVYCHIKAVSPQGAPLPAAAQRQFPDVSETDLFPHLVMGHFMGCSSAIVRRTVIETFGGFDPNLRYIEDWEFNLRVSARNPVGCVPKPLTCYRRYPVHMPSRAAHYQVQDAAPSMLERVLKERAPHTVPDDLNRRALANAWWLGAKIDYATGQPLSAQTRFARALELDKRFLGNPQEFIIEVVDYAHRLYAVIPTPFHEARNFIDAVFAHLPPAAASLSRYHGAALGWLHAAFVFAAHELPRQRSVGRHMLRAIWHDPAWARNSGLLSIGGEAMLGSNFAGLMRKIYRRRTALM